MSKTKDIVFYQPISSTFPSVILYVTLNFFLLNYWAFLMDILSMAGHVHETNKV